MFRFLRHVYILAPSLDSCTMFSFLRHLQIHAPCLGSSCRDALRIGSDGESEEISGTSDDALSPIRLRYRNRIWTNEVSVFTRELGFGEEVGIWRGEDIKDDVMFSDTPAL